MSKIFCLPLKIKFFVCRKFQTTCRSRRTTIRRRFLMILFLKVFPRYVFLQIKISRHHLHLDQILIYQGESNQAPSSILFQWYPITNPWATSVVWLNKVLLKIKFLNIFFVHLGYSFYDIFLFRLSPLHGGNTSAWQG